MRELYSNLYMFLYEDGTLGLSDGVGYIDTLNEEEVMELYLNMKKLLEEKV